MGSGLMEINKIVWSDDQAGFSESRLQPSDLSPEPLRTERLKPNTVYLSKVIASRKGLVG